MTSPTGPAVIGRSGGAASGTAAERPSADTPRDFDAGPVWMRILPPLAMLGVLLWGLRQPSYWRDEAATLAAVQRPFGALLRMLGHVDAVHGAYYMIIWVVARLAGTGELAMRLPSVIATVVASVAVTALGRRLVSPRAGLAAGMVFAAIPQVSFHGQEARSYAMVVAMAAIASYLLVRAIDAQPGRRRGWLAGYAAALVAMCVLNIFALLLIAAHAVTVGLRWLLRGDDEGSARELALGWLAAAAAATVLISPVLVLGWQQRGQISWLKASAGLGASSVEELIGPIPMVITVAVVVALGILVSARAGRERLRAAWPPILPVLCLPWLILPGAVLLGVSAVTPIYTFRYILFCIPAAALIVGAGLAVLGRVFGTVALAVAVLLSLHAQLLMRGPAGHGDNIRAADQVVAAYMAPGDVVLYTNVNAESFGAAYPYGLARLRDIGVGQAAIGSGTLAGTSVSPAVLRQRLAHVSRLWVVDINVLAPALALRGLPLKRIYTWRRGDVWLRLYVPRGKGRGPERGRPPVFRRAATAGR
jgi:mannosyltransferase